MSAEGEKEGPAAAMRRRGSSDGAQVALAPMQVDNGVSGAGAHDGERNGGGGGGGGISIKAVCDRCRCVGWGGVGWGAGGSFVVWVVEVLGFGADSLSARPMQVCGVGWCRCGGGRGRREVA